MHRINLGRLLRVFTPFTLLLAGLIILNYTIEDYSLFQPSPVPGVSLESSEPTVVVTSDNPAENDRPESIATAIANATPVPTRFPEVTQTPVATLLPKETFTLTGPPAGSRLSISLPLTFYWVADRDLAEGESFELFLVQDNDEIFVGSLSEPNLGNAYQVNFIPESKDLFPGNYYWMVKVVEKDGGSILGESERRTITLVSAED
jgi:hypothetical protein